MTAEATISYLAPLSLLIRTSYATRHGCPQVPRDSKVKDSMGRGNDDSAALALANWLCTSVIADNPITMMTTAQDASCQPKAAVEVRARYE